MRRRAIGTGLAAVLATAGVMYAAAPSAQAHPAAPAAASSGARDPAGTVKALYSAAGFQALIDSVADQVHALYPNATFRDAVGTSPSGVTTSVRDVVSWKLNFDDVDSDGRQMIVQGAVFLPSSTALINVTKNATVYSRELTEPVAMSPFEATLLLRTAGYREPFRTVIYAQPIGRAAVYPHPLFIIDQGDDRIQVDSVTREVKPFRYSVGPTA